MIATEHTIQEEKNKIKDEKSRLALEQMAVRQQHLRVSTWITIICTFTQLEKLHKAVQKIREAKKRNVHGWKACKRIQRAWRRFTNPVLLETAVSLSQKLKSAASNKDSQQIYQQRSEACDQIYKFLKFFYIAGKAHCYLRKIRKSQEYFRRHRVINTDRLLLLSHFFQECLYPLTLQINLVLSNRGLDIKNSMTSFEINTMNHLLNSICNSFYHRHTRSTAGSQSMNDGTNYYKTGGLLRKLIKEFFTAEFHALLRSKWKSISFLQKEYLAFFLIHQPLHHQVSYATFENEFGKLWRDCIPSVKRKVLLAFLLEKRRQFVYSLHTREPLHVNVPTVSINEAFNFIQGGRDPLISHVAYINDQIQEWQNQMSKPIYPFRRKKRTDEEQRQTSEFDRSEFKRDSPTDDWKCPLLLLLSSIAASDVLSFILQLGEVQYTFSNETKKSSPEKYKLHAIHRKLSTAMTKTAQQAHELAQASRSSSKSSIGDDLWRPPEVQNMRRPTVPKNELKRSNHSLRKTIHKPNR
jgi:hypothetical protein